jgi:hypothetical protein
MSLIDELRQKYPHLEFSKTISTWNSFTITCSNGRSCELGMADVIYAKMDTFLGLAEERLGLRTKIKWFKKA